MDATLEAKYEDVLVNETFNKLYGTRVVYLEKTVLLESSMSRIYHHIKSGNPFVIISAYQRDASAETNNNNHKALREDIRKRGYGFIEQYGGYTYKFKALDDEGKAFEDEVFSHERSFFIPNMKKATGISLGQKYNQVSIVYKDDTEFATYYCKDGVVKDNLTDEVIKRYKQNDVETKFDLNKTISTDPYTIYNIAYSALVKNNSRRTGNIDKTGKPIYKPEASSPQNRNPTIMKRYAFHVENVQLKYVIEGVPPSWGSSMGGKQDATYLRIL